MELPKQYNANDHEDQIYKEWEDKKLFKPEVNPDGEPYSIMLPPPNATGVLHLGHATMLALEDVMIRYHRMKGDKTLWLPGTDHAGIATQTQVEKILFKEEGKTKDDLGREEFLQRVRDFVAGSQDTIRNQVRKMGASVDWDRERYTFEDALNRIVNEVFVKMYHDGLIYRGNRLINWSVDAQSVLADDEQEWEDKKEPFYFIQCGEFIIGTVRPETKCADSPVVVHPDGEYVRANFTDSQGTTQVFTLAKNLFDNEELRLQVLNKLDPEGTWELIEVAKGKDLEGKAFEYDTYAGKRKFYVLADEVIDMNKGTGAMTISSAHSADDYDLAKRRGLDETFIQKIDFHGKMTDIAGPLKGKTIAEARKESAKLMKEMGLIVGEDTNYVHRVPLCYRTKCVVEPMISMQWFVDVNKQAVDWKEQKMSLKEVMQDVVRSGEIKIIPERFEKTYFHWIDNLRDWCVSRQLWWGHRIPVWYRSAEFTADGKGSETYCGVGAPEGEGWKQDEDALDTWYSSGLWTFSTLVDAELTKDFSLSLKDLLEKSPDYQTYHPTSVLETGYDILFFWIARMILMTTYATGEIPFKNVYLHGLVRDKQGRKFSKSLGNGIDPLDVIADYGADAVRLSLMIGTSAGNDTRVYVEKIEGYRNFVNKLWNIGRYILMSVEKPSLIEEVPQAETLSDKWILSRFHKLIASVTDHIENYRFSPAGEELYTFTWSELADWYVEDAKVEGKKDQILLYILTNLLKLWHPYTPYVTEVLWKQLRQNDESYCITSKWPQADASLMSEEVTKKYEQYQSVLTTIRNCRAEFKIAYSQPLIVLVEDADQLQEQASHLIARAKLDVLQFAAPSDADQKVYMTYHLEGGVKVWILVDGLVDKEKELLRLQKSLDEAEKYLATLNNKLSNQQFVQNAPEAVVTEQKEKQAETEEKITSLKGQLEALS